MSAGCSNGSNKRRIIHKNPRMVISDVAGVNYEETITPIIPYAAKKGSKVKDIRSVMPEWKKTERKVIGTTSIDDWTSYSDAGISRG